MPPPPLRRPTTTTLTCTHCAQRRAHAVPNTSPVHATLAPSRTPSRKMTRKRPLLGLVGRTHPPAYQDVHQTLLPVVVRSTYKKQREQRLQRFNTPNGSPKPSPRARAPPLFSQIPQTDAAVHLDASKTKSATDGPVHGILQRDCAGERCRGIGEHSSTTTAVYPEPVYEQGLL